MKNTYQVDVLEMKEIHELPEAWTETDFLNLLKNIEYDDVSSIAPDELKEMTSMALSELDVEEASEQLLLLRLADRLNKGQRKNLTEELKEDRIWEEYSELKFHKDLFNICTMLHSAFPKKVQRTRYCKN